MTVLNTDGTGGEERSRAKEQVEPPQGLDTQREPPASTAGEMDEQKHKGKKCPHSLYPGDLNS